MKKINGIKNLREALGYSQIEFAEAIGVSQGSVSFWERNICSCTSNALKRIVKFAKSKKIDFEFF